MAKGLLTCSGPDAGVGRGISLGGVDGPYLELPEEQGLPVRHPRTQAYIAWSTRHARRFGLVGAPPSRLLARFQGFVGLDTYTYSYATADRLIAAGLLCQWLYFLDDRYDDEAAGRDLVSLRRLFERLLTLFEHGREAAPDAGFESFTTAVRERLRACGNDAWWAALLADLRAYLFEGSYQAIRWWQSGSMPDEHTYRQRRLWDAATLLVTRVVEVTGAWPLPEWATSEPEIERLRWLTATHIAFANDLFSYRKEVIEHGSPWNLVAVVMHKHRCDLRTAVSSIVDGLNDSVREFEALSQRWSGTDPGVAAYVRGLRAWVRGNVGFSLVTPRYSLPLAP